MKKLAFLVLAFAFTATVRADTYVYTLDHLNATIPDGDLNGYQSSQTLAGLSGTISDVNVTLNISGAFNGDLYAFISHGGQLAVLVNRVGRFSSSPIGYPDAGFGPTAGLQAFTLDDQAQHDVHAYGAFPYIVNPSGQLTGIWQPDGRALDPLSAAAGFDTAARANLLSVFNGTDPNGLWTLFVADVSPGAEGALQGWGLQVTVVPEPGTATLLLLGVSGAWLAALRRTRRS